MLLPRPQLAATALDRELLKKSLLALSAAEKLRIAGNRIRLAAETLKPPKTTVQPTQPGKPVGGSSVTLPSQAVARCIVAPNGPKGVAPSGTPRAR
jgi:hypothetical protein